MTEDVWALLEEIKNGRRACIIPVLNDAGSRIGELRPVTVETPDDAALIEAMTRWRQRFMRFFLTQFQGSPNLTQRYLSDVVLKKANRILFILSEETGRSVGHLGLANIGWARPNWIIFCAARAGVRPSWSFMQSGLYYGGPSGIWK